MYREAGLDPAEEAETLRARGKASIGADFGEPGVGTGLLARRGVMRTGDPGAERGGCVHARVLGLGSRYGLCQPESDASAGWNRGRAGTTASDSLRQRAGTDESPFPGVVCGAADRVGVYSAGEADAECARRELPRTAAGRVFGSELVSEPVRCAAEDRGVEDRVQRGASAQQSGIPNSERVRCPGRELIQS